MSYTISLHGKPSELPPAVMEELRACIASRESTELLGCEIFRSFDGSEGWQPRDLTAFIGEGTTTLREFEAFCSAHRIEVNPESRHSVSAFLDELRGRELCSFNLPSANTHYEDHLRARRGLLRIAFEFGLRMDDPQAGAAAYTFHLIARSSQIGPALDEQLARRFATAHNTHLLPGCQIVRIDHDPERHRPSDLTNAIANGSTTYADFEAFCRAHDLAVALESRRTVTAFMEERNGRVLYVLEPLPPDVEPENFARARHELVCTAFKYRLRLYDPQARRDVDVP